MVSIPGPELQEQENGFFEVKNLLLSLAEALFRAP